jgi:protein-disulfide isomerase
MRFLPLLRCWALAAAACLSPALAVAQPAFTDTQRQAIGEIVKDYLVKNPEVLQEAMAELERRQTEGQKAAQASALRDSRETLLNSPRDIVAGNPTGDVTLVEFFDYNCGYCKRALADVRSLVKADPKLRVVLKDFPVLGPESLEASRVSLAAKQQIKGEKLFDFHSRVMETRGRVNGERALAVARRWASTSRKLQKDMEGPGGPRRAPGERQARRPARPLWHARLYRRRGDHFGRGRGRTPEAHRRRRAAVRQGGVLNRSLSPPCRGRR